MSYGEHSHSEWSSAPLCGALCVCEPQVVHMLENQVVVDGGSEGATQVNVEREGDDQGHVEGES